jgi:hypothetical protein
MSHHAPGISKAEVAIGIANIKQQNHEKRDLEFGALYSSIHCHISSHYSLEVPMFASQKQRTIVAQ